MYTAYIQCIYMYLGSRAVCTHIYSVQCIYLGSRAVLEAVEE